MNKFLRNCNPTPILVIFLLLTNALSVQVRAQTYNWQNVAILGGGFVPAIVYSPVSKNLIYARTDIGGFYRWNVATGAWVPLNDSESSYNLTGGESIAPDPVDSNVVYMAAGMYLSSGNGVILRSADKGNTWTTNTIGIPMGGNQNGRGMGERLAVDPNNTQVLYFASRNNGLYKSTNAASSWAKVSSFPVLGDNGYGLSFVTFDKSSGTSGNGSKTIYVGVAAATATNSNLYKSTDGGTTWAVVTGGPTAMMPSHGVLGSDGNLWLSYTNDYGPYNVRGVTLSGQIWKYTTSSGTWTNVTPPTTNWGGTAGGISVDAQNPQHIVVATLDWYSPDRLLATTNGGTSWNVIAQPPVSWWSTGVSTYNINGAQYQDGNGTELVGTGATNWVQAVAIDPFNSNNVMYGTGAGIWATTNAGSAAANGNGAGTTWTFQDKGLEETACIGMVPSVKGAFFSILGDIEGTRSSNVTQAGTQLGAPYSGNTTGLDFAEKDSAIVAKVSNGTPLVSYSADNGQTWTACTAPNGSGGQDIAVSATGGTFVYAPNNAVASYSTNNGTSWTACTGIPSGARVAADRVNASKFYAVSGGNVYTSTNGGVSFTETTTGVGNGLPRPVFGIEGEFWVSSGTALYKVTNSGTTATKITNVTACNGVGFGKAATGQTHPAVFIIGTVGGVYGFFRSDNNASTWNQTNDSQHQYSAADYCAGDELIYGRMYVGTNGRGIVYGDIQTTTAPTATITPATTTTFCSGGSVVLNANTGTGYTYQWNKGGTAISAATAASYTATTSGSYTVTVISSGLSTTSSPTTVTVNTLPPYQAVAGSTPVCAGSTAVVYSITATTGNTYAWTVPASVGTIVGSSVGSSITVNTINTSGTGIIKVTEKTTSGCSSLKYDSLAVTVNAIPAAPTVSTPVAYCQGATASTLTATGAALKWYTVASGGTSSATAPTPSTTTAATTSYYVSQTTNTCESPRATIAVTVNAIPAAPPANTPVAYCQGATASALAASGAALQWYTVPTGGTGVTTAPTPSTTTVGTTSYYVSQTTNTCESPRAVIAVTINAIPAAPTVSTPVAYCQGATATALTATGTALKWYTVASGGTSTTTAPTPSTTATGTTSYYVTQTTNTCESPRATLAVTVNAIPGAPTVSTPVIYCQAAPATALTATGTALKWYTVATGGTASTTAPTPSTTTAATTSYYVSQTTNTCESPRATIAVTVNPFPTAVITVPASTSFCQGSNEVLTANTGSGLSYQWNNAGVAQSGATGSSYTATTAGNYTVTVSNTFNCSTTSTPVALTVTAPPTISNAGSNQYTTATTANLSANTPTSGTGSWSVVSGTANFSNSASATSSVNGLSLGANVLQWTISNGSCTPSSSTVTINVGTTPTIQTITGPSNATSNETGVTYSVPDNAGSTYHWTLPAGATITSANTDSSSIIVSFETNGGTVSVTETNPYGTATSTLQVSVGNAPVQQTISGQTNVATNATGITYSVADDAGSTYHWTLPAGVSITSANTDSSSITASFGTTGGTVSVKETNSFGNATSSLDVSVGNPPTIQTISGQTIVTNNSTGITYSVPDNNGSTYHWTLPAGATITSANADSSNITASFGTTGGSVSVTETNPYGNATSTLPVSVGDAPTTQTISGQTDVTSNETGVTYSVPDNNGSAYDWTLPAGAIITSANTDSSSITVNYGTSGGTVSVTETNPYGNATSTITVSISSTTAVIAGTSTATYEVRPNPFSDYTTIIVRSQATESISLSVIDVQGVTCYSSSQYYTNQEFTLRSELSSDGVYFVQIAYGNEIKVIKLIKIK